MKTLLEEIHDIIEEGDNGTSHDIVDIMFNLLDVNQLNQLQDIVINQIKWLLKKNYSIRSKN